MWQDFSNARPFNIRTCETGDSVPACRGDFGDLIFGSGEDGVLYYLQFCEGIQGGRRSHSASRECAESLEFGEKPITSIRKGQSNGPDP
jgi:hypothetical protein